MAYQLYNGVKVEARPGQLIRCSAIGNNISVVDSVSNGLGMTFRANADGTLTRVIF